MSNPLEILANSNVHIGLLLCDHVRTKLQPEFGDYPEFFRRMISRIAPHASLHTYDITRQQFPAQLDECDVYMISGSKKSCYESIDWITRLHHYVRQCYAAARPLVGICFGHQVMARALGGESAKSTKGWGVSVHTYMVHEPQLFGGRQHVRVLVSHQDQVIRPGDQARVVATNDFCPNAILAYGTHSISTQGHPEFTRAYSRRVLEIRRNCVGEQAYNQALLDYAKQSDEDLIAASLLAYHLR